MSTENKDSSVEERDNSTSEFVQEEEAPPSEDEQETLKWRGDPAETFSDWTIEIVEKKSDRSGEDEEEVVTATYHVHKAFLAFGARRSEYFVRLFRNEGRFHLAKPATSRIYLEPLAAKAFPQVLDYMYSKHLPLEITVENATALHYLGDYLLMRHLRWEAQAFCKKSMSLETMETFYQHGEILHNELVKGLLTRFVRDNLTSIQPTSKFVERTHPQLWVDVLGARERKKDEEVDYRTEFHVSQIVASIGTLHQDVMDAKLFQELTAESIIPIPEARAALTLCALEDKLCSKDASNATATNVSESETLSNLQHRCASNLAKDWRDFDTTDEQLKSRKSPFLAQLLHQSLQEARWENQQLYDEVKRLEGDLARIQSLLKGFKVVEKHDRIGNELRAATKRMPSEVSELMPHAGETFCSYYVNVNSLRPIFWYDPSGR